MNPVSHPLNTFVLQSTYDSQTVPKELSQEFEKVLVMTADYTTKDMSILPREFEPQNKEWVAWMVPPENQGSCGSCWSFATVSVLSDRFNILSRKRYVTHMLSPLVPTVCNDITNLILQNDPTRLNTVVNPFRQSGSTLQDYACHGNTLLSACYFLVFYGTTRNSCMRYSPHQYYIQYKEIKNNWAFPIRNSLFYQNLYDYSKFQEGKVQGGCGFYNEGSVIPFAFCDDHIRSNDTKNYGSVQQHFQALFVYDVKDAVHRHEYIMYDIYRWGPVVTCFLVYEDFYEFDPIKTNVYIHDPTRTNIVGGHSVSIVGWGEVDGIPFWWIKNSWGTSYGYKGYFRFLRGKDQCGIESNVLGLLPNLFFPMERVSLIHQLEQQLEALDIFHSHITPEYIRLLQSILPSFQPIEYSPDIVAHTIQQFPLLHYFAISRTGFLTTDVLTSTGYNTLVYRIMPSLSTQTSFFHFPEYAGRVVSTKRVYTDYTSFLLMTLTVIIVLLQFFQQYILHK